MGGNLPISQPPSVADTRRFCTGGKGTKARCTDDCQRNPSKLGLARRSPHPLMQELLHVTPHHSPHVCADRFGHFLCWPDDPIVACSRRREAGPHRPISESITPTITTATGSTASRAAKTRFAPPRLATAPPPSATWRTLATNCGAPCNGTRSRSSLSATTRPTNWCFAKHEIRGRFDLQQSDSAGQGSAFMDFSDRSAASLQACDAGQAARPERCRRSVRCRRSARTRGMHLCRRRC